MNTDEAIRSVYLKDIKSKKTKHKKSPSGIKFGKRFNPNSGMYTKDLASKYKAV